MSVVNVVCVTVMLNGGVTAICAVRVRVVFVCRVIHRLCFVAFLVLEVFKNYRFQSKGKFTGRTVTALVT